MPTSEYFLEHAETHNMGSELLSMGIHWSGCLDIKGEKTLFVARLNPELSFDEEHLPLSNLEYIGLLDGKDTLSKVLTGSQTRRTFLKFVEEGRIKSLVYVYDFTLHKVFELTKATDVKIDGKKKLIELIPGLLERS